MTRRLRQAEVNRDVARGEADPTSGVKAARRPATAATANVLAMLLQRGTVTDEVVHANHHGSMERSERARHA